MTEARRSPLDAKHRALGARMVDFGGWEMPLSYAGVLEEHRACRTSGAVFDVSHLGSLMVSGSAASDALDALFSNDLGEIGPGRAQYTLLLDEDGGVLDDLIVWWVADELLHVIPNASNTTLVRDAVGSAAAGPVHVDDVTAERALLAVQGPRVRAILGDIDDRLGALGRFEVCAFTYAGQECLAGGTGYTGEDGLELFVPASAAEALFAALLDGGLAPAGLGARDTLRLEMGYPLHGHELGPGITPVQARLEWAVEWDKPRFPGRAALLRERATGPRRLLLGLATSGRQAPRAGCAVLRAGEVVGEVTSGNFSPSLERGIGLALLDAAVAEGDAVTVDVRGRQLPARVMRPPFIRQR